MIEVATNKATGTSYYGVSTKHLLSTVPLKNIVESSVLGVDPMIGWYWRQRGEDQVVFFKSREDAETFQTALRPPISSQ